MLRKSLAVTALAYTLAPAAASAAPVYLECMMTLGSGQKETQWNVTLDEAAGSVAYTIPELGTAKKALGIFTADKVRFDTMEISRIDLTFTRTINLLGEVKRDQGQCKMAPTPTRKF
ncbi:hypothetical protein [Magnetospirillum aberrantis]|uniref:Uncharacterized protein n=1 Tax=Magnetospirillum aberrantis SpK TaxID=908842 RepID=A0A7C9QU49_9PROT|nr:hypothetical protein [Magnetospirillum aberrantis]NFV80700.1 hypothetical protein [Magnetospirillum aberrantis SpK]